MDSGADLPLEHPTLGQYVGVITRVGLTSFGGGLSAWMMRIMVHERRWLTEPEFLTGLALCQVFPGINVVNLAIWIGYRTNGWRGAVAGALAIIVPPGIISVGLLVVMSDLAHNAPVRIALNGVAAAAVGMGAAMGIRAARRCLHVLPACIMLVVFLTIGVFRLPLLAVMAVMVPLSVGLAWREPRPAS
jgi:chromate transporter